VFKILTRRTVAQIQHIRNQYKTAYGADLFEAVKKETHGHFEDFVKALVLTPAEYDAYRVFRAVEAFRLSNDDDALIDILAHREAYEIRALNDAHQQLYKESAQAALEKGLGGELGLLFSLLADPNNARATPVDEEGQLTKDVQALYDASQGKLVGHHAEPFIRIFAESNRAYLQRVYNSYANKHGKTLEKIIKDWVVVSHIVPRTLLAIITPAHEFYSNRLNEATSGIGTNDNTVVRIIASQRERYLPQIADHFMHTEKVALKERVRERTGGDFKNALVSLLEYYAEAKV